MREMRADHLTNVLRMRQVQRGIHFIQNVHGRWLEEEERQDQGQRQE